MRRRNKVVVAAVLILVIFLVGFVLWLNRPKPPFQHVPFHTQNFEGFPSELVVERSEGEFDNSTMALASYVSDDEAFLGIKIWNLDYNIDPDYDGMQWFDFHNLEVLAFTKKDGLELRELTLQADVSVEGDGVYIGFVQPYNLNLVQRDRNGDSLLVFHGVGYSNKTGFKTDGDFRIYIPSKSPLRELTFTLTLSYARGLFGLYGASKVSTSLKVTIKQ